MTECHFINFTQDVATDAYLCNLYRLIINIVQYSQVHN